MSRKIRDPKHQQQLRAAASRAIRDAAAMGASPRAQLDAARAATRQKVNYLPHQGAREKARRAKQIAPVPAPLSSESSATATSRDGADLSA